MNYLNIDLLIVIAFLLISLVIGLRAGRGIKDIRDYALANRSYGTTALVFTYLATHIGGGSIFGDPKEVFTNGIGITLAVLGLSISFAVRAIFIAPRMHHFKGCLTLGDVVGSLYGPQSKLIAGVLGALFSSAVVGLQLSALGTLCTTFLGVRAGWGIVIGGLILATYSTLGGIKAVTATDIFQFLVLFAFIPLVATIALNHAGGFVNVVETVPIDRFTIWNQPNFSIYLVFFLVWVLFFAELANPADMQRMLMAKDGQQLRNMLFASAAFDATFRLTIMVLALSGLALYPHIAPETVVTHTINSLLPNGIKGLAISGMLAIIMSTADSYLHAAGISFAHDVVRPFSQRYQWSINELKWAQYATLLIGLVAILVGLHYTDLLKLSLQASGLIVPILSVPLAAGIMGLKPNQRAFYTAMVVTLIAFLAAKLVLPVSQQCFTTLIALFTNAVAFFGINLLHAQKNTSN